MRTCLIVQFSYQCRIRFPFHVPAEFADIDPLVRIDLLTIHRHADIVRSGGKDKMNLLPLHVIGTETPIPLWKRVLVDGCTLAMDLTIGNVRLFPEFP